MESCFGKCHGDGLVEVPVGLGLICVVTNEWSVSAAARSTSVRPLIMSPSWHPINNRVPAIVTVAPARHVMVEENAEDRVGLLENKVAIVTGAGSGIGEASAQPVRGRRCRGFVAVDYPRRQGGRGRRGHRRGRVVTLFLWQRTLPRPTT